MTTFSWKRKVGQNISKATSLKFTAESDFEPTFDAKLLESHKRKKLVNDENCKARAEEHKRKGIELAQNNRFKESLEEFNRALNLCPRDEKTLEMKAQTLLQLEEAFPAVQSAERAVKLNPRWWVAYQTLGRSQLGIGDLKMAKISFCKAIHLNPAERELWEEDLKWTLRLIEKESNMKSNDTQPTTAESAADMQCDSSVNQT